MLFRAADASPIAHAVIVAAAACIVIAFTRWAASIVAPILLALFITVIATPPMLWMRQKGMPKLVAVLVILFVILDLGSLIALTTTSALESFKDGLPRYQERLVLIVDKLGRWLESVGIDNSREALQDLISAASVSRAVYAALTNASGVVVNGFLVLLIVAFMLVEAPAVIERLRARMSDAGVAREKLEKLSSDINRYMLIKVILSAVTALCIFIWLWLLNVDYAVSLSITAFLLNFIPVVGNILMTLPAVLVALVQGDVALGFMVVLGYAVVNVVIGNVIEPQLTGRELGISSVLLLLSLLFWGWVLGPVGLFLSAPLTMALKTALEIHRATRPTGAA